MDYAAEALKLTNQKRIAAGLPPLEHFGAGKDGCHHDYVVPERFRTPPFPQQNLTPPGSDFLSPKPSFPDEIRIWPQVLLCAAQQRLGGAIRLWAFAKALDLPGSGVVKKQDLLAYLIWLGVPSASRYRWLKTATQSGLLQPVRHGETFLLAGLQRVGKIIGIRDIGRRCLISAKTLSRTHWKSSAWDLVLTQFKDRPVSRATLHNITGIPVRTQIELERFGLVNVHQNWCITAISPDLITPYREFERPYAFVARFFGRTHTVYQMPNNYSIPKLSGTPDGGGYRRKSYAAASASVKSDNPETSFSVVRFPGIYSQDGGTRCEKNYRLYYDREKPFSRALRKLGRAGIQGTLYQKTGKPIRNGRSGWYIEERI